MGSTGKFVELFGHGKLLSKTTDVIFPFQTLKWLEL